MLSYNLLKGKRIYLNRFKVVDIDTIVEWYEDEEFARNLDTLPANKI